MNRYSVPFALSTLSSSTLLACFSTTLLALEPAPIRLGVIDFVPTLDTAISHTDNLFLASDNAVDSRLLLVTPRLSARASDGISQYSTTLEFINGNYSATKEDDFTDWKIGAEAQMELNVRNLVSVNAEFFNTHEMRGTGFSQGDFFTPVPDKFNIRELGLGYQLGTNESRGRLVAEASRYAKDYTNNELTTFYRNREDTVLGGTFYVGMLPSTDFLFQYRHKDIDYVNDPLRSDGTEDSLDSNESYAYVGATWEATAKTTGTLKLGYGNKDFTDPDRIDRAGPSWEASVHWEPLSYSTIDVAAGRVFGEQNGIGSGLDSRTLSIGWEHSWTSQFKSSLAGAFSNDNYLNSTRKDKVRGLTARMDYSFDSWLDLYVSAGLDERDSVLDRFNYTQNIFSLGFAAGL